MKKLFYFIILLTLVLSGCKGMFTNEGRRVTAAITNSSSYLTNFTVSNAKDDSKVYSLAIGDTCSVSIPEYNHTEIVFTDNNPVTFDAIAYKTTIRDLPVYTLTIKNISTHNLIVKINNEKYNATLLNGITSNAGSTLTYNCYTQNPLVNITYDGFSYNSFSINNNENNPVIFIY